MKLGANSSEQASEWRQHSQKVLGRAPISLRADPFKGVFPSTSHNAHILHTATHNDTDTTNTTNNTPNPSFTPVISAYKGTIARIRCISDAWVDQKYTLLRKLIGDWGDLFDPSIPHTMMYFIGFGGVEVFVRILCEPPRIFEQSNQYHYPRSELAQTLVMVLKVLTEVLLCHSELSWVLYDRFPGVFFRLLELIGIPSLRQASTPLLEHLISNLGPIFEIARTPLFIKLLRSEDEGVLASVYRIVALLVVPFFALRHSPLTSRHIIHPESMLPLKRVQRVIDSNVLWLLAQPNVMDQMIRLCELRADEIYISNSPYITLLNSFMLDTMSNSLEQANPLLTTGESLLINSIEVGFFEAEEQEQEARVEENNGVTSLERMLTTLSNIGPLSTIISNTAEDANDPDNVAENVSAIFNRRMMGLFQQSIDEAMESSMSKDASKVDFSWFLGVGDVRQRWRLQDLILTEEEDDTRPLLYCGSSDSNIVRQFKLENQAVINWLAAKPSLTRGASEYLRQLTLRSVVESQSEILFVLNVMLSTFYFSGAWMKMKACRWIPRANRIYDAVFFINVDEPPLENPSQHVELPVWVHRLPRFQTPPPPSDEPDKGEGAKKDQSEDWETCMNSSCSSYSSTRSVAYPSHWRLRPFEELLGPGWSTYMKDFSSSMLRDRDDLVEDKHHYQHVENTMRKLEFIHCVHEFWNTQDRHECELLHSEDIPQHAKSIVDKMARSLESGNEETCVEEALSYALEGYLRCFSFPYRVNRNVPDCPQTILGEILLPSIFQYRIYNATRLPGLMSSLKPLKRFEAIFTLTAELVRYHFPNLYLLVEYMCGKVSLTHLNDPKATRRSAHVIFRPSNSNVSNDNNDSESENGNHHYHRTVDKIIESPPLERQEFEPFGCVLLNRLFRFGCEANLFIRAIALSITPGLRSSQNYIARAFPNMKDTQPAVIPVSAYNHVGDLLTGYPMRLAYIRKVSRKYVLSINKALLEMKSISSFSFPMLKVEANLCGEGSNPTSISDLLVSLLDELVNAPHRFSLKERPFPNLFSEDDRRFLRGEDLYNTDEHKSGTHKKAPFIFGPPPCWSLPLFSNDTWSDSEGVNALGPLNYCLLAETHKLVFSIISPLNAELMMNTSRLCAITTVLVLFLRQAHLQCRLSAIDDILERLKPLAERGYRKWQRKVRWERAQRGESPKVSLESGEKALPLCAECARTKSRGGGGRCSTFLTFGECFPPNKARLYYLRCGGCFYRNFFRLLCMWTGHYAACQKYLETLYFSTEVAFAEYKTVLLYLLRVLPNYFLPSMN